MEKDLSPNEVVDLATVRRLFDDERKCLFWVIGSDDMSKVRRCNVMDGFENNNEDFQFSHNKHN